MIGSRDVEPILDDAPHDECGVFGVFVPGESAAKLAYYGLYALQHRGQESAGIAVSDGETIVVSKEMGLVNQVFDEGKLASLTGHLAIGHVRYSTAGSSTWDNAQPRFHSDDDGNVLALAHNGNLTNTATLAGTFAGGDKCTSDSDLLSELIFTVRQKTGDVLGALQQVLPSVEGAFSLVLMDNDSVYAARDRFAVRPLALGKLPSGGWVVASETSALDITGAVRVQDVNPGEIVKITESGIETTTFAKATPKSCVFEYVYVARPDHQTAETTVYAARRRMGQALAEEAPASTADLVIGVPDSGLAAASGYAEASGLPYADGLIKNRYVGRTFIQPTQSLRQLGIRLKLNPLGDIIEGKRLVVVDDSIVRGNTSRQLVRMLRDAGAAEVHLRITSPPVQWPCFYGIDMATRKELIGAEMTVEQIGRFVGADSLAYLSLPGLIRTTRLTAEQLCTACFNGVYPIPVESKDEELQGATLSWQTK